MIDLISRQALMKEFSDFVRASNNSDFDRVPTWNDAVSLVGSMPSAQQWIPCSERLPEEGKEVLISTNGSIYTAEFDLIDGNVQWYDTVEFRRLTGVDAWMPLPEPYNQEDKQ